MYTAGVGVLQNVLLLNLGFADADVHLAVSLKLLECVYMYVYIFKYTIYDDAFIHTHSYPERPAWVLTRFKTGAED